MNQFKGRSSKLQLVLGETNPSERMAAEDDIPSDRLFEVEDVSHLGSVVHSMLEDFTSTARRRVKGRAASKILQQDK